jgi:hypothetical protein
MAKVEDVCPFFKLCVAQLLPVFGCCCSAKSNRKTTKEQNALKATARHPAVTFLSEMAQTFRSLKNKT